MKEYLAPEFLLSLACVLLGGAMIFFRDKDELGMSLIAIGTGAGAGARAVVRRAQVIADGKVEEARVVPPAPPPTTTTVNVTQPPLPPPPPM